MPRRLCTAGRPHISVFLCGASGPPRMQMPSGSRQCATRGQVGHGLRFAPGRPRPQTNPLRLCSFGGRELARRF